jgi:bacterioferritin-associated ferredoxin
MIDPIRVICPLCRRWTDPVEMLRYVGCGWICARCFEAMRPESEAR